MKQVIILEDVDTTVLQDKINKELKNYNSDNTELQFTQSLNENELIYACMIVIKNCS